MATSNGIDIPIKTTVDAKAIGMLEGSLAALRQSLAQAKKDFDAAAPGSAAWKDAAERVVDLGTRVNDALRPLRDMVVAKQQLNTTVAASVNPWTTANKGWDAAAHNLLMLTERARSAKTALEAQARAAEQAAKAGAVQNSNSRQDAVANAQRQMVEDMHRSEAATRQLKDRLSELPAVNEKVQKSSSQAGRGVLEISRAFEDAQYGIAGVLNNLPGIITMFGGAAGLAGALSMAAVAGTVLWRTLSNRDWTGTWIGDMGDALGEMITGIKKSEQEARDIMSAPDSWRKTGADAVAEYQTAVERTLSREIELLKQRNELLIQADKLRTKEAEHAEKMFQINNPNQSPKGTEEWSKKEIALAESEYRQGRVGRDGRMDEAYRKGSQAEQEKAVADQQLRDAKKYQEELRLREDKARELKFLEVTDAQDQKRLNELLYSGQEELTQEQVDEEKAIRDRMAKRKQLEASGRNYAKVKSELDGLAKPLPGEEMDTAHARAAADVQAKQGAVDKAGDAVFAASNNRITTKQDVEREDKEAAAKLQQRKNATLQAEMEKAAKDAEDMRTGKDRVIETMPDTSTAPAPGPAISNESWKKTKDGLANMANNAGTGPGSTEFRQGVGALNAAFSDGKGNAAGEVDILQQMREQIASGKQSSAQALEGALRAMEAIQTDGSQMQQKLTGALNAFAQTLRGMNGSLDQLRGEFDSYRDSNRK